MSPVWESVTPRTAPKENGLPHQSADWFAMTYLMASPFTQTLYSQKCLQRVDVASHIPARSAACAFLSHAAGIDPYARLPYPLHRADRVVRPYEQFTGSLSGALSPSVSAARCQLPHRGSREKIFIRQRRHKKEAPHGASFYFFSVTFPFSSRVAGMMWLRVFWAMLSKRIRLGKSLSSV